MGNLVAEKKHKAEFESTKLEMTGNDVPPSPVSWSVIDSRSRKISSNGERDIDVLEAGAKHVG